MFLTNIMTWLFPSYYQTKAIRQFWHDVDLAVALYDLDPTTVEVQALKNIADDVIRRSDREQMDLLYMLNPARGVTQANCSVVGHRSNLTILDPFDTGQVLRPWTKARHHVPDLDARITQIMATRDGVYLICRQSGKSTYIVHFMVGQVHPEAELEDFVAACDIINAFTGMVLDPHRLVGRTETITVNRVDNGEAKTYSIERVTNDPATRFWDVVIYHVDERVTT